MGQYQTLKTQAGLGLEAGAETGRPAIKLVSMSVGDGGGNATQPSAGQTGLVHEVDRVNLNSLFQNATDATQWVAEAVFPADRGGYTVREVGLWTDGGVLFAVANFPDTYKPSPSEGTAGQLLISLNFRAQNSDNITLVVDGNLQLATLNWTQGLVDKERERAEAAEAKLQPAGDYAIKSDLLNVVQTLPTDSDNQINHIGVNKASGDIWGWNGPNNIFFHMASVSALQAESLRAQTAESVLQPAGDYALKSDLLNVVQTMPYDSDYQMNHIGVNKASGDIWGWNGPNNIFFHMASVSALQAESLRAQTAESGLQPAGNYLIAVGGRRKKSVSFTVSAVQGQRINFPEPFANADVQVFLTPQDTGGNHFHMANWFSVDQGGFLISLNVWNGGGFVEEKAPTPVMVRAEGYV